MKKALIVLALVIGVLILFNTCRTLLAAGSYPFAEHYTFNVSEETLIAIIDEFKQSNVDYIPPVEADLKDKRSENDGGYWYHIYLYYRDKNQLIHCWVRENEIALVGVNQGLELGHWKQVNDDYKFFKNKAVKEEFEKKFLDRLGLPYTKDKDWILF